MDNSVLKKTTGKEISILGIEQKKKKNLATDIAQTLCRIHLQYLIFSKIRIWAVSGIV